MFFKVEEWKYKKEWRLIFFEEVNDIAYLIDFSKAISGIYIGAKAKNNEEIIKILKWAEIKNIPIHKMHIDEKEYAMYAKKYELD